MSGRMRHGSLFSGIGGFDLAAQWMGWENVFHCEINPFGRKVLNHYWPESISYENIITTDFTVHRGGIDIITGGFPCQPFSIAGKRKGTEDERHLWPEMLRAIREIQPRYIVGENVPGLINWDGGVVFEQVQADLENEGYEVTPFILPACGVNAPHRRDRVWFVANTKHTRAGIEMRDNGNGKKEAQNIRGFARAEFGENSEITTNTRSQGCEGVQLRRSCKRDKREQDEPHVAATEFCKISNVDTWDNFPTQHPVCGRNDGLSSRLAGITVSKHRNESIKAYGNAIVPQVVYQIFKAIQLFEDERSK